MLALDQQPVRDGLAWPPWSLTLWTNAHAIVRAYTTVYLRTTDADEAAARLLRAALSERSALGRRLPAWRDRYAQPLRDLLNTDALSQRHGSVASLSQWRVTAPWFGLWWGGPSYSTPADRDLELFPTVEQAEDELADRYLSSHYRPHSSAYLFVPEAAGLMPTVGLDSEILLYADPRNLECPALRVFLDAKGDPHTEEC